MPRIRSIKPYIWGDDALGGVSRDARLLFVGMMTQADDDGRLVATGSALAGAIYPYDDLPTRLVERWRDELRSAGLIRVYRAGRATYAVLVGWDKHQRIQKRQPSSLPAPPDDDDPDSAPSRVPVAYQSRTSRVRNREPVSTLSGTEVEVEVEVEEEVEVEVDGTTHQGDDESATLHARLLREDPSGEVQRAATRALARWSA